MECGIWRDAPSVGGPVPFDQRQGVAFVASQDGIMTMLTWDEGAGRVAAVRHIELTF